MNRFQSLQFQVFFHSILLMVVLNIGRQSESADPVLGPMVHSSVGPGVDPSVQGKLLVLSPNRFHASLKDFVAHKESIRPTELLSLEAVLENGTGVDDPEKIKRYLFQRYIDDSIGFVLLVGDVDSMPVRYMVLDRATPAAFDYAFYPSDLYYGDLAKEDGSWEDWNGIKDSFHAGYFGEVRGEKNKNDPINYDRIDYRPEIAVGRWPVETADQVQAIARKSIQYERLAIDGSESYLHRATFISVGGWVDSRTLFDKLASQWDQRWLIDKRYYSDRIRKETKIPTHESIREVFREGTGLAVHAGHGQSDAWEQCFSAADLDKIANGKRLPIVVSAGCSTAYFAPLAPYGAYVDVDGKEHPGTDAGEQFTSPPPPPAPIQGRFNPTGLGEAFLRHPENGSVAYIGCNTGSQPCGLTLVEGFVSSWAAATSHPEMSAPCLGTCWNDAIKHYYRQEKLAELAPNADWYPPSIFFQGMKFMLFGDPSLQLAR